MTAGSGKHRRSDLAGQLELDLGPLQLRPPVRISPAQLSTWRSCPLRYRMLYRDRHAPPRGGGWAHLTLGAVVHNVLRAYGELPESERRPERAAALLATHWSSEGFRDTAQAARYRAAAAEWLVDYLAEQQHSPAGFAPEAVERSVSAVVDGLHVHGRIDRVDRRTCGTGSELVVIDYKTGKRPPTSADAADSTALALYAMVLQQGWQQECHTVELHHLPSGTLATHRHPDGALQTVHDQVLEQARQARDATEFPARTGPHCSACPVRAHCPDGQRAAPELAPWELLPPLEETP